ncbi:MULTISPECIES: PadR family transcriptional regulator [Microbispora]|uniref:PadR family transcriptional regulator n=1 Tax=Microbispora TaxID=2005 RepID=UPI0003DD48D1|nr:MULTISPECIES: helix-turn-helix transcriptional regulator [Microbispora]ETK34808.1 transcriptional regulator [Microbispora sp. ATCC PTA-5024]
MTRTRRLSPQTEAVLRALAADPSEWRYGYELGREVDLKAGSLYPILMRLADRGLLESSWEKAPVAGRPPRHLYRLTGAGLEAAAEVAARADSAAERDRPGTRRSLRGAW